MTRCGMLGKDPREGSRQNNERNCQLVMLTFNDGLFGDRIWKLESPGTYLDSPARCGARKCRRKRVIADTYSVN